MRLPIIPYGHKILGEKCPEIETGATDLADLIPAMWETMYGAQGCGLAAPQVDIPFRLFVVDSLQTYEGMSEAQRKQFFEGDRGIREVFINPKIIYTSTDTRTEGEGCLSIPEIYQPVERPWSIQIEYVNQDLEQVSRKFSGVTSRMIQHEYDHIEGVLFLDHLNPLTRLLLRGKLSDISAGKSMPLYPMKFLDAAREKKES